MNTKQIWGNSYSTWNFPVSQAISIQTCNILCYSSQWTCWAFT